MPAQEFEMPEREKTGGQRDDVRQANEEGDPREQGRSRGHVVDENDPQGPSRTTPDKPGAQPTERSENWESGRHRAN
jgi:hypothetical protein